MPKDWKGKGKPFAGRLDEGDSTERARSTRPTIAATTTVPLASGGSTLPGPQLAGGSFVVDRAGNILAFDRNMERLTGWQAVEIVGHTRDFGVYDKPDELGLRRFERKTLFDGRLPQPVHTKKTRLTIHAKNGGCFDAETLVTPLGPGRARFAVEVQKILTRVPPPVAQRQMPSHDPLTRLAGPDMFRSHVRDAFQRVRVIGQPLSILLIDIDSFDQLSQHEGRERLHEVLRRMGGIVQAMVRGTDLVARVKQDGFAIALEGAGRGEARHAGGRIRQTIEQFAFERAGTPGELKLTVSVGIACYPADGDSSDELIKRCSDALAEAKRLGKNRVWCYARRPRVLTQVPVYFDGPAAHLLGRSRDLSNSGLFVETQEDLRVGMRLGLMFKLPGEAEPVRCVGRVSRRVPPDLEGQPLPPGLGIEFERYSDRDQQQIDSHIHRVQGGKRGAPARR